MGSNQTALSKYLKMAEDPRETEVKFCVCNLLQVETDLRRLKAHLIAPRTLEVNLRFDTPTCDLQHDGRVLRLRRDETARLTYKDNNRHIEGAVTRREIEFVVDDFDSARQFIEALGYDVVFIYEKYRTTYALSSQTSEVLRDLRGLEAHIMLDELPYGNFVEIEGELETLRPIADGLQLDWDKAVPASYHSLFDRLHKSRKLTFRDLTFENFANVAGTGAGKALRVSPEDMQVEFADHKAEEYE